MRSEAIKCGWFAWLVAIFLVALLSNHAHAAESQSATGNAFSKIKPASQQVRQSFNFKKPPTIINVGVANNSQRFGKLSLILSTDLSGIGKQSIPSRNSTPALNNQQGRVENVALNELNVQIAYLEATIQAQEIELGLGATVKSLPEQATRSVDSPISASDTSSQSLGMKMKGGWLVFGLVVVILLVALGIFWMRKQKAEPLDGHDSDQITIGINKEPEDIQGSELTPPDNTEDKLLVKYPSDTTAKENTQSVLPPEYEMLEEADIYLRFGHDKLAEEALREAIKINVNNSQSYLKLLRIYFSRDDTDSFLELAKQTKQLGDKNMWSKVAEMGRNLDEGNSLYQ
ncbi:MAG: hypothetical protein R8M11_09810 [Gallionella sp.]